MYGRSEIEESFRVRIILTPRWRIWQMKTFDIGPWPLGWPHKLWRTVGVSSECSPITKNMVLPSILMN
jgi:hypothetical protein